MKRDNRLCRLGSEVERFLGKEEVHRFKPGRGLHEKNKSSNTEDHAIWRREN